VPIVSRSSRSAGQTGRAGLRLARPAPRSNDEAHEAARRAPGLERLATLLAAHAPYDGVFALEIPGVHVVRRSRPAGEMVRATVLPTFCVVAQGAKTVMLGREVFSYDASRMVAYAVDLPIAGQIVRASAREPFLALVIRLDPYKLAELTLKAYPHGVPSQPDSRAIIVGRTPAPIIDAAVRLLDSMAVPAEAELLAPLVLDEILIRLLLSAIGPRVAQVGQHESSVQRVARAVSWIREHFAQPVSLEALADMAHMSVSSFHQHFKAVTAMTPLQYQKVLRLQEARRLMLSRTADAGGAGRAVGYLSASQFSREYARLFGRAPTADVAHLRAEGVTLDDVAR
jgi:AraC-like DNA-binding protein